MQDDVASTPHGLLKCLQFLADEAAGLALHQTLLAIHRAIETCQQEYASRTAAAIPSAHLDWMH